MIESTEGIHEIATVREQYVESAFLTGEDSDTLGWVEGEAVGFDIDTEQEHEYGELKSGARFNYDMITSGPIVILL